MLLGRVASRSPQARCWVFRSWTSPRFRSLLTGLRLSAAPPSTGPSPAAKAFAPDRGAARGSAPPPCVLTAFLSTVPRSDSWQRRGWTFALASIPPLLPEGSRSMFAFPVTRPFVGGGRLLSTIPALRTLLGLPGSRLSLPPRVARTHRGTLERNHNAFISIVQTRPFSSLGRPVPPWAGALRLRPGGALPTLQISPRGEHPVLRKTTRGGSRSVLAVSRFRLRARVDFSLPSSSFGQ
jgi:hypothetical protein